MFKSENLIERLNFVSENFPSYFLSFKKTRNYHKRTKTGECFTGRKKLGPSVVQSPINTSRTMKSKNCVFPKTYTPRNQSGNRLFFSPLKKGVVGLKELTPSATRIQISRPTTNHVSKLSIPLREKPRSPNSKYLYITIPKVSSKYI
jgi:hypothetical protein